MRRFGRALSAKRTPVNPPAPTRLVPLAPPPTPSLDDREQAVMDHILAAMRGIEDLGLRCNETELAMHVHGLQAFVIQHMLQRVEPGEWGSWFEDDQLHAPQVPPTNPGMPT